ncbi:MAG: F0F1 ATP synthase subunit A [Chloroflexi bacterium]|nr:F0F1 ATP synthase subunit A [Chloroflexota bacterium]
MTASTVVATTLPIGEHWIFGPTNSIFNLHADTVLLTLLVCAVLLALGLYIRSHATSGPPSRIQNMVESIMSFLNGIIEENLGRNPGRIASIALTLFFFILISNLLGLIPVPKYLHSPTSDVNATFALAILVFILLHAKYLGTSGLAPYKGHYWTNKFPQALVLNPLSVVLGLVNELSRPLTLSFRLFGNILAGEVLLVVWAYLLPAGPGLIITGIWNAIFVAYGVFVGVIQAFIFTVLTIAYMAIASEPAHEH